MYFLLERLQVHLYVWHENSPTDYWPMKGLGCKFGVSRRAWHKEYHTPFASEARISSFIFAIFSKWQCKGGWPLNPRMCFLKAYSGKGIPLIILIDGVANFASCCSADAFDRDRMAFNCANGTVDLATGELREHNRADMLSKPGSARDTGKFLSQIRNQLFLLTLLSVWSTCQNSLLRRKRRGYRLLSFSA